RSSPARPSERAVKAVRLPGSASKPFVYLTALEDGYPPVSLAYDGPTNIAGWRPKNYSGAYQGEVSLRNSLAQSINTVAVRLASEVGPSNVGRTAQRLGIQSKLEDNPSIALRPPAAPPLQLT